MLPGTAMRLSAFALLAIPRREGKVVIYFMVGRHIQANANKLLAGIRDRSDGHVPFFTSDELKHYDAAIMGSPHDWENKAR
jgi:hypothetical protein